MMRFRSALRLAPAALVLVAAVFAFTGCSDDAAGPSDTNSTNNTNGTLQVAFGSTTGSFEVMTNVSGDPTNPRPGPFLVRGTLGTYDEDAGALPVDFTVTNMSDRDLPLPVTLTFVSLIPDSVAVLNPDGDETGAGAWVEFSFEDGNDVFSPQEESLPRTVNFQVEKGAGIGLVARVDVGLVPGGGAIGGMVFNDVNENGIMDVDETGIAGVRIVLFEGENLRPATSTLEDGSYLFENLPSGVYTVIKPGEPGLRPTTPTRIMVALPETDGEVAHFLAANFGCVMVDVRPPRRTIQNGDRVHVKGDYLTDPDRVMARVVSVEREDDFSRLGRLAGPVTAVDVENGLVAIMGTWIHPHSFMKDGDGDHQGGDGDHPFLAIEDLEIGDLVRVDAVRPRAVDDDSPLEAGLMRPWDGNGDRVVGIVQNIRTTDNADNYGLLILGTWVEVTADTRVEFGDGLPR